MYRKWRNPFSRECIMAKDCVCVCVGQGRSGKFRLFDRCSSFIGTRSKCEAFRLRAQGFRRFIPALLDHSPYVSNICLSARLIPPTDASSYPLLCYINGKRGTSRPHLNQHHVLQKIILLFRFLRLNLHRRSISLR